MRWQGARQALRIPVPLALFLILLLTGASAAAGESDWCGEHRHRYGPFDYTNPLDTGTNRRLAMVEEHHFTEEVRQLRQGASGPLIGDLEYVLNWFPNHHPALEALVRLVIRSGGSKPPGARADLECRFKWALDVRPDDAMVRVIQGLYRMRLGDDRRARAYLQQAAELEPENAEIHYNLGLALYRLQAYQAARTHAERAYALGYPLPGLRKLLAGAGYPVASAEGGAE